jgi:hypothetical protein
MVVTRLTLVVLVLLSPSMSTRMLRP